MLVSWEWLKEYIGDTTLTAPEAAALLGNHAFELEGIEEQAADTIIDVDILPNRSSDCLCQRGIARELASITGIPLTHDPLRQSLTLSQTQAISVTIADSSACPRFTASVITGIEVKESPQWLKARLAALGQRSINNIVDATNYVMYAIGQPLHAYDAELFPQVDGQWQFVVRYAAAGESVSLLAEGGKTDDRIITCEGTELLIVDASSNTPIGLAGVKGGRFAGVHAGTTQIIVEAAHFDPTITRKTARRLGIVIDASKRFENEPSRELPPYAQAEIIQLITDIAGGACEGVLDVYLEEKHPPSVTINMSRVNALLGLSLTREEVIATLERTGTVVHQDETATSDELVVVGPWERTDLNIEEDFIEEVGRLYGYDNVLSVVPDQLPVTEFNVRHYYSEVIRQTLVGLGFSEIISYSFRNQDQVQLKNALASDKSYLRSTLSKNIAEALDQNSSYTDLLGTPDTRVFEIGTVFYKVGGTVAEHVSLALGVRLKPNGYSGKEDTIVAEAQAAIAEALGVSIQWKQGNGVAETNLSTILLQLPEPVAYNPVVVGDEIVYQPFSAYPHMSRDIALWVTEGTQVADVLMVLNQSAGPLRVRTTHIDEFTKDGRISMAFRLVFQSTEKTLTDQEVGRVMEAVYAAAAKNGWDVR